ncbi:hypothetical protein SUVZ_13G1680 [Saccharomyces uvarum]|uniref:Striatin N-terminal domain-containing protein n=1 Tax=Saccharomyces uvarum TaxID=230603 RepID=A0ABN8WI58_SACUV|nr:hypothetical protein SUVZ_13G1680 [Saccharomyces uvarum]
MAINQTHVHPHYTLPGVMHYLQTEFTKNERDRITWELERSEMKARIAKLEGENRDLKYQLNHVQSNTAFVKDEGEEKSVSDSLLKSKLAVQENVKEIIYLLKSPNVANQLDALHSKDAGFHLHDLERLNINSSKEGNSITNGMDLLNNALSDVKPKEDISTGSSSTKVESLFAVPKKHEDKGATSKIHSDLPKIDIISSYGDHMALYDADTRSLEIHKVDASLGSKSVKKMVVEQGGEIVKFFWVSPSKFLVIDKSFHLKLFSISNASLISDLDLLQGLDEPLSFDDIINIDFKNNFLLIAASNKPHVNIWELNNIDAIGDIPIDIKETYVIVHDDDDDDDDGDEDGDATNILDCILGITEKSLILLSSNPYQLVIYNFEGVLLQKINLKLDAIFSRKMGELVGERCHLFLNEKTSKLLIQLNNETLFVYSFDQKKIISKEKLTPVSTLPIQIYLNDSIITISYSNGDFGFKNLENLEPLIDEVFIANINLTENEEHVIFSSNLIVGSTPVLIARNKNNEILLHKIKI